MIDITHLSVMTGHQTVLQDITLSVEKGSVLGLLGPSGAGKTTLLRTIAGLNRPCSGDIRLSGQTVTSPHRLVPPHQRKTAMVFQSLALWPHMTARKHLEFVTGNHLFSHKTKRNDHIQSLLDMMHLNGYQDRYPAELSGGEQQRLAIARALASRPAYLLMDEPFSSLDDILKRELLDLTRSLKQTSGMTILYVTHDIQETLYLADKIIIMKKGKIVHRIDNTAGLTKETLLKHLGEPS
ncbi:ATP-binding cassette domain-containing protein [Desulfobacula sp.]|uniref:ABC transporter ATP-binding protein n=1 Tax=Desulfobacula sp. TaxID=2593537 RepID=UPI002611EE02|nr:ATP-binding cassette domain-containing protein [Desulfobacula sp.]